MRWGYRGSGEGRAAGGVPRPVLAGTIAAALLAAAAAGASDLRGEDAAGMLDPIAPTRMRRGRWAALGTVTREALPGASEWRLSLGIEPKRGIGARVDAGVLRGLEAPAIVDGEGALVIRRGPERLHAGAGIARSGRFTRVHVAGGLAFAPSPALLVALDLRVFPGERGGAPDPRLVVAGAAEPWLGTVELANAPRLGFGVRVGADLWWTARMAGSAPAMGLRWRAGRVELAAEEERHPHLGRVTRFAVAWGGRRR